MKSCFHALEKVENQNKLGVVNFYLKISFHALEEIENQNKLGVVLNLIGGVCFCNFLLCAGSWAPDPNNKWWTDSDKP